MCSGLLLKWDLMLVPEELRTPTELSGQERWCGQGFVVVFWGRGWLCWDWGKLLWERKSLRVQGLVTWYKQVRQPLLTLLCFLQVVLCSYWRVGEGNGKCHLFPGRDVCECCLSGMCPRKRNNLLPVYPSCFSDHCIQAVCPWGFLPAFSPGAPLCLWALS